MSDEMPAELVGGPEDGQLLMIAPGSDGLPMEYVQLTQVDDLVNLMQHPELGPTEVAVRTLTYSRDAISERTHRWIYRLDMRR